MCIFKFITFVNMDTFALEKVSSRCYNCTLNSIKEIDGKS